MVAPLRDPPARLPAGPPARSWAPGERLVRVYHEHPHRDGLAPRTFGPLNRFDPHIRDRLQKPREDPQGRGVLYAAAHQGGESVALWERAPALERVVGGDRRLWAVWPYVMTALAPQRRYPRRITAEACRTCQKAGYTR